MKIHLAIDLSHGSKVLNKWSFFPFYIEKSCAMMKKKHLMVFLKSLQFTVAINPWHFLRLNELLRILYLLSVNHVMCQIDPPENTACQSISESRQNILCRPDFSTRMRSALTRLLLQMGTNFALPKLTFKNNIS